MGYDAFGLPAEQYAVQTGTHPRITTEANIATMRRQLRRLGLGHDPRRGVATTDAGYYRWTQWIFLQIFDTWYDARRRTGPARSPSWRPSSTPATASRPRARTRRAAVGRPRPGRARRRWSTPTAWRTSTRCR